MYIDQYIWTQADIIFSWFFHLYSLPPVLGPFWVDYRLVTERRIPFQEFTGREVISHKPFPSPDRKKSGAEVLGNYGMGELRAGSIHQEFVFFFENVEYDIMIMSLHCLISYLYLVNKGQKMLHIKTMMIASTQCSICSP